MQGFISVWDVGRRVNSLCVSVCVVCVWCGVCVCVCVCVWCVCGVWCVCCPSVVSGQAHTGPLTHVRSVSQGCPVTFQTKTFTPSPALRTQTPTHTQHPNTS